MPEVNQTQLVLYEMMYILDPALEEDGIERMNNMIRERIVGGGGEIAKDQSWGVRKLAYQIKKRESGYYHVLEFHGPRTLPEHLKSFIRTQAGVLRHLIIKVPKAKILQEQRDAAAAARREKEPAPPPEEHPQEPAPEAPEQVEVEVPAETAIPAELPAEETLHEETASAP